MSCKKLGALLRGNVILTPRASRTSAAPHLEEAARLPCLATGNAAGGDHESRSGGDIKGIGAVAAGSYDLQNIHVVEQFDLSGLACQPRKR